MQRTLLAAVSIAALTAAYVPAMASSHREAPMITEMPKVDGTDFYMFNSYEPGRTGFVTIVADYQPFEAPVGGPNYYLMDHNAQYDINIDNQGAGTPNMIFRFKFNNVDRGLALPIGARTITVPLVNIGPITSSDNSAQNVVESYTATLILNNPNGTQTSMPITGTGGMTVFPKPIDNIGNKTIADYPTYASAFLYTVNIPGCATPGRMFVGQRKDPFVVNLGETFDLINYANPVGIQYANSTKDDLSDSNVTAIELEVPASCLVSGKDPVVGGWTTAEKLMPVAGGKSAMTQVSRLANPLVNELIIGLPDKDKWNATYPAQDQANFLKYFTNPTLPALIQTLFGTAAPTAIPRQDLPSVFLTGLLGVNRPAHLTRMAEEMRLNTSIPPTAYGSQNRLGVVGGDSAGYPNGRRPGDDAVTISLQVAMGDLYTLGLFGMPSDAPSGGLYFTDGAYIDDTFFDNAFPYLKTPIPGSPQSVSGGSGMIAARK